MDQNPIRQPRSLLPVQPSDPAAIAMTDALSDELLRRTGSDGRGSFEWDESDPRHLFLLARDGGETVGCGGIRPLDAVTAEVKRLYAHVPRRGVGASLLAALEQAAALRGFERIVLATRVANPDAVAFYDSLGWQRIPGYGKYAGSAAHQCYARSLVC